jgi:Rap1a immunity proteins
MRTASAVALAVAVAGSVALAPGAVAQRRSESASPAIVTHAQTASDLAAICDPAWGGVQRLEAIAYCQGFLTSFGQYHTLLYPQGGPARPLFCVPVPGPTVAQSGVAFAAWARENPRYGNEPALDGLLRWAQANFPCPTRPPARSSRSTR